MLVLDRPHESAGKLDSSEAIHHIHSGRRRFVDAMADLWGHPELLIAITRREIRVRYKQTLLGIGWAVAQPLALMVVFTLVFSKFMGISSDGHPYAIFAYSALLPWSFLSGATTLSAQALVKNVQMVTKVWFPRETLPLASVVASLFDYAIGLGILLVLAPIFGLMPTFAHLWLLPLVFLQFLLTLGIAFWVSAVNVRYRDVKFIVPLALQLWLYMSPVIYPLSAVPDRLLFYYRLNPTVGLIEGYRAVILEGGSPDLTLFGIATIGSIVVLATGWRYFNRVERFFADVI